MSKVETIHFIWIGKNMPTEIEQNYDVWKKRTNNNVKIWVDKDLKEFGVGNWSNTSLHPAQRADFYRIQILSKYGGWYIDSDCLPGMIELPAGKNKMQLVYQDNYIIPNSFLYSPKDHPFLPFLLGEMSKNLNEYPSNAIPRISGPYALRSALYLYLMKIGKDNFHDQFEFLPKNSFIFYPAKFTPIGQTILGNHAFAIHYSNASWVTSNKQPIKCKKAKSFLYFARMFLKGNALDRIRNIYLMIKNYKMLPRDLKKIGIISRIDLSSYLFLSKKEREIPTIDNLNNFEIIQESQYIDIVDVRNTDIQERISKLGWNKVNAKSSLFLRERLDKL